MTDNDPNVHADEDFLTRERAALGEDAGLFASANDKVAVGNANDEVDLLGGDYKDDHDRGGDLTEFESSFPAVDAHNEVNLQQCWHLVV